MLDQVGTNRIGGRMAVNRDEFFAELDKLTDQQIEERLPLWNREELMLVQQYIDRREIGPPEPGSGASEQSKVSEQSKAEPEQKPSITDRITRETTVAALTLARKASAMAMAALILSIGAMLTAIVAGAIVYLSLRN